MELKTKVKDILFLSLVSSGLKHSTFSYIPPSTLKPKIMTFEMGTDLVRNNLLGLECGRITSQGVTFLFNCKAIEELVLRHNVSAEMRRLATNELVHAIKDSCERSQLALKKRER
ncbi:hypothetical protein IEQ34_003313 [Dendrobium chrysotoxum]|uniref:Uncharacterized protein n=1 Tax=Dendrobium chrysotoxum TaxID=161865 RepID=A0AAV7HJE7_DENCH|nr:hypothetical protein IEQ34_003313 [Dendrobium chrysotoxum]